MFEASQNCVSVFTAVVVISFLSFNSRFLKSNSVDVEQRDRSEQPANERDEKHNANCADETLGIVADEFDHIPSFASAVGYTIGFHLTSNKNPASCVMSVDTGASKDHETGKVSLLTSRDQ